MKNIPTITIRPQPLNINVPNTGGGSGNPFTNWTPQTGNFGGNTGVQNVNNILTFNPPSMNIPNNIPSGNIQGGNTREINIISQAPHNYSGASQQEIDKHFAISYENSNGRLDINGFCNSGNQAVEITVEHLKYQAVQKDNTNGTGHKVLAHKHTLNFSFNLMNDEQMNNLTDFLKWQNLDLKVLNLSSNNITFSSIEPLFYNLQVKPDHLPHSHLRTHNIQYTRVSN